jgi:hypothetical protein
MKNNKEVYKFLQKEIENEVLNFYYSNGYEKGIDENTILDRVFNKCPVEIVDFKSANALATLIFHKSCVKAITDCFKQDGEEDLFSETLSYLSSEDTLDSVEKDYLYSEPEQYNASKEEGMYW